ncbi:MAG: hypothetical protein QOH06_5370 [Acidobacteriota bacterium]|nr:hypothetical protein [Acidobacteriota bacterium]
MDQPRGQTASVRHILHTPRPQTKLAVGAPDDAFEKEADQVADHVMRMPESGVQRMCHECEEELQAKEEPGQTPSVPDGFENRFSALQGSGRPLPASERAFFEPRFGRDFSNVRLHSGPAAGELARSVHARAFTLGDSIVLGPGESGRDLLAHELTHVVQQGGGEEARTLRRQTIHSSCTGQDDLLHAAWAEGERMARETADSVDNLLDAFRQGRDPEQLSPGALTPYRNAFGDGVVDNFNELSRRFRAIERGFTAGKVLRCDPKPGAKGDDDCEQHDAFVILDNKTDVFICPSFFAAEKNPTGRGLTLLHEMAHSVLGITHKGGRVQSYSCEGSFGFRYADARQNAYAYAILANCLHGEGSQPEVVPVRTPARRSRWSISGAAGADVATGARRFASVLGANVSLGNGEYVVWNKRLGFNLLYLSDPSQLVAATAEVGVRIQQPLRGFYFDVSGGGFAGFKVDQPTAGLTGTAGLGFRFERLELGVGARAVVPGTNFGDADVLILGRAAWRFR